MARTLASSWPRVISSFLSYARRYYLMWLGSPATITSIFSQWAEQASKVQPHSHCMLKLSKTTKESIKTDQSSLDLLYIRPLFLAELPIYCKGYNSIIEEWHTLNITTYKWIPHVWGIQLSTGFWNQPDVKLFAISLCANIAWWFFLLVRYLQWIGFSQLRLKSSVSHGNLVLCSAQPTIDKWAYFYWT